MLVGLQERGWEPLSLQYSVLITFLAGCTTPLPAATCFFSRSPNQVLTRILSTQNITFFGVQGKIWDGYIVDLDEFMLSLNFCVVSAVVVSNEVQLLRYCT